MAVRAELSLSLSGCRALTVYLYFSLMGRDGAAHMQEINQTNLMRHETFYGAVASRFLALGCLLPAYKCKRLHLST